MIAAIFALALQAPDRFFVVDEEFAGNQPAVPGRYISTCEFRVIGREAAVLLDTKRRGLPIKIDGSKSPSNLLEFAASGLGVGGSRAVSEPETGHFAWVTVTSLKKMDL